VESLPHPLSAGDGVRTGARAHATIRFDEDSRVELGPYAAFSVDALTPSRSLVRLDLGHLKASIKRLLNRRFQVRTPTAVASVRGTEFNVSVLAGGRTHFELLQGLLGVEDNRGHQVLLHPSESVTVDRRGMNVPQRRPSHGQIRRQDVHSRMDRELGLDMDKEEVLAAAARELKLAELQQGKALVDVHGNRVRVEEYVIRPRADQFKLVVLNKRESRFDYFYYLGTFNKALPDDLSTALRQLGGSAGAAPSYYLTGFETGRSNLTDSLLEVARGGHPVDVNGNADASDDIAFFFDTGLDRYRDVSGESVYQTLFDDYGFYLNGKLKYGWSGTGIQAYSDAAQASTTDPLSGAALTSSNAYLDGTGNLAARSVSVTFPNGEKIHQKIYESYSDGAFLSWDNYIIDDEGNVASFADFDGIRTGTGFKERLLRYNYEQVITASEFSGRKIDLVIEPRILLQSGLIQ